MTEGGRLATAARSLGAARHDADRLRTGEIVDAMRVRPSS